MNIIFMGTPLFAVPSLKNLISKYNVQAVITQPDKKRGRGNKVVFSPVKEVALENNIPIYQPDKIRNNRELINKIIDFKPDFIVVVAFGQILSKEILDIPEYGCINLHASLLPNYRGAAPINWALIKGEKVTGNTTMLMDEGLDTGDMLLKNKVVIDDKSNFGELYDILRESGADLLIDTIEKYKNGEIPRIPQNKEKTFYAKTISKEFCFINWKDTGKNIFNFVRGLSPIPCSKTHYMGKQMKIYSSYVTDIDSKNTPGTIVNVNKEGIMIATLDKNIVINEIQIEGGKRLFVSEYIKGHQIKIGEELK